MHDVQADGSWKCGKCGTLNRHASKCSHCHLVFYSLVTTTAPAEIFCSRCGFLNDGDNLSCVQCDNTIRSTLDKISTDLKDSTNFLARDMGVNIHVKCPGCFIVCYVPPATACLRCGACHTYFASPSVGEVTNFHMSRLASSISSSFLGFFGKKRGEQKESNATKRCPDEAQEAPLGKLIATGQGVVSLPRDSLNSSDAMELSTGSQLLNSSEMSDEEKEDRADSSHIDERPAEPKTPLTAESVNFVSLTQQALAREDHASFLHTDPLQTREKNRNIASFNSSNGFQKSLPMLARQIPMQTALPLPRQELIEVEGDILEL